MNLCKELFHEQTDVEIAKNLFKQNIEVIELGISSYCNRICDYCPNNFVDRRSTNNKMDDKIFFRLMEQLKEINYSGTITLHRYNEPFSDFKYAVERIKSIKEYLPNAKISISTNGDYLNSKRLKLIHDLMTGGDSICITVHNLPGRKDFPKLKEHLISRVEKLNLPYRMTENSDSTASIRVEVGPNMSCDYRVINFYYESQGETFGLVSDRGECVKLNQVKTRTAPCFTTFIQMQIEWDGKLQPCCNIHSDVPQHEKYNMGQFDENGNIFLIYASDIYTKWRNSMFTGERKASPCSTCTYTTNYDRHENDHTRMVIKELRKQLDLD